MFADLSSTKYITYLVIYLYGKLHTYITYIYDECIFGVCFVAQNKSETLGKN